ncbi:hypothetical protein AB0K15_10290 [Amycolatopsis sp. NPDC049253]|uniref:hypothetical protein n=1 Tax=Amycolatopsis sp. NPDC049253 TaxID=3155274 RepID=UPI003416305D
MSVAEPTRFLTVDFSTPVDIGFLPQHAETPAVPPLTIGWAPRLGTTYLPFDPADETVPGRTGSPRP